MRGLATQTLSALFKSIDIREHLRRRRTYPGFFPVLHLDHIYYEGHVDVRSVELPRTPPRPDGLGPPAARRQPASLVRPLRRLQTRSAREPATGLGRIDMYDVKVISL